MSDFLTEVIASKTKSAPAPTETTLISGGPEDTNTPEPAAAAPTPEAPAPAPAQAKPAPIRIGTEVFETPEEAIKYATELQLELAKKDAYELGKSANQTPKDEAPTRDEFDDLEDKIFENPKETIKKIIEMAEERAEKRITTKQAKQAEIETTWRNFYSSNQDLADNKDVVDFIMQKNWNEVGTIPVDKALKIIAEKTRSFLSSRKVSTLPTTELPSAPAVTTAPGVPTTQTVNKKEEIAVDFIAQLNKHRKRG
jgi:hypothetical protein